MKDKELLKHCDYQIKDIDKTKGVVTIYINAFGNEDTDGDISMPGSFKKTFKDGIKRFKHLLNHDLDKFIGLPIEMYEDEKGAIAISKLNIDEDNPLARTVFSNYKFAAEMGRTLEHSIRVRAIKRDTADERKVLEWKLIIEYSTLYGWGSNPQTPLIDIKSINDLELMIKSGCYSDEDSRHIENTYNTLKQLYNSNEPPALDNEPPALDKNKGLMNKFFDQLNIK